MIKTYIWVFLLGSAAVLGLIKWVLNVCELVQNKSLHVNEEDYEARLDWSHNKKRILFYLFANLIFVLACGSAAAYVFAEP